MALTMANWHVQVINSSGQFMITNCQLILPTYLQMKNSNLFSLHKWPPSHPVQAEGNASKLLKKPAYEYSECGNKNTLICCCSFSARNRRKNGGGQSNANGGNDVFNVPKNLDVQLETSSVQVSDLIQLRFYAEYQWLLDFALYAIMVYTLTEVSLYHKTCQTKTTS